MHTRLKPLLFLAFAIFPSLLYSKSRIVVSKEMMELYVIEKSDTIFKCPVAVGRNFGDKEKTGDKKTPEGTFSIRSIEDSSSWTHDFNDGKGIRKGAYGPFFFRLKVPRFNGIGIHGTCKPESIGTRDSEGCVRLYNADLQKLRRLVYVGMPVTITKDKSGNQ